MVLKVTAEVRNNVICGFCGRLQEAGCVDGFVWSVPHNDPGLLCSGPTLPPFLSAYPVKVSKGPATGALDTRFLHLKNHLLTGALDTKFPHLKNH